MRILITGGNGFIGRAFAKRFLDTGHTVTIVDDMSSGVPREDWAFQPNSIEKLQLLIGECRSFFASAGKHWAPNKFDLILHCAAIVGGRVKIEDDPLAVGTDLSIDSEFFNWVSHAEKPLPKVIYFSSSAAYPTELQTKNRHCKLSEELLTFDRTRVGMPDLTYGFVKLAGEYLAKFAVEKYGVDVKIYRPFGGYGEDQGPHYPFTSILKRIVDGENPVQIWGPGDQQRDFIYVGDVVDCVLATMDVLPSGGVLNIGSGVATSFFDLAERAIKLAGKDATVINVPTKPSGVYSRVADPTKMLSLYQPKINLDAGIKKVLDFLAKK